MSDKPKFLLGNYIDRYCDITVTSGSASENNIYNGDRESYWVSSGETAEAGFDVYVECIFKNSGGTDITRAIDAICIRNTNAKKFRLRYSATAAGAFSTITNITYNGTFDADGEILINADDDIYITFTELTAAKIRIEIESTIVASEEKKVGEFMAMHTSYTSTQYFNSIKSEMVETKNNYRTKGGTLRNWFDYRKYSARIKFVLANTTMMENLRVIKMNNESFCIYPEPISRKGDIWMVRWVNDWDAVYTEDFKGAGYTIKIDLEGI